MVPSFLETKLALKHSAAERKLSCTVWEPRPCFTMSQAAIYLRRLGVKVRLCLCLCISPDLDGNRGTKK
jgi:hypothetical protein